ncbi:MAG: HAD family hydrolase [Magnetospirillum sp.]|nr:HAD family hydrolase [Magnetospirillum sp.]
MLDNAPDALLFDFDGVIVASASIRDDGFRTIFADEPPENVERLLAYHHANGGLSRYHKIRWYFETVRKEPCGEERLQALAQRFKAIMLARMADPALLIPGTVAFIRALHGRVPMHVVSGSDGEELRTLCGRLGLAALFVSILGSPTPKTELVRTLMAEHPYAPARTAFIGDAINDHDAARASGLVFWGFGNERLRPISDRYIDDFATFPLYPSGRAGGWTACGQE